MRFEELYYGWHEGRLSQEEAARVLGVCSRTFRRQICRYEETGLEGLNDKRLTQASHRRAPVDEVMKLGERYRRSYRGWNVKHFYSWYIRDGGKRSYTWVKNSLTEARVGSEGEEERHSPPEKRTESLAGDDVASGREHA
ncbi:MAG: helix-turn-helix domain-containing protein [Candidatus Moduliflexus flocculans]|nr:helix-turn-helix domain-containing protein [Candidatus Moduliflexus flocculans]